MESASTRDLSAAASNLVTTVTRQFTFEASHQLEWHQGKCAKLHGHSYRLMVSVGGPVTADGIVIDFADLKNVVERTVLHDYDHAHLNDFLPNPTAELIAADIAARLLREGLAITEITISETANCSATVRVPPRPSE